MPRLPRRLVLAALLGACFAGCLSPTLPLPPPSKPDISGPNEQGLVILTGTLPHPNARAFAFNEHRNGDGDFVQTGDDAAYRLEIRAAVNDELQLWYEIGHQKSPSIVFLVPAPATPDGASDAGADADAASDAASTTDAGDGG